MRQTPIRKYMDDRIIYTDKEMHAHAILADRARKLAKTDNTATLSRDVLELITFQAGGERFGVDIQFVREVQPLIRDLWSLVPCTPGFIVGAVNIRGRIYAMMNIADYLGISATVPGEGAHTLLVRDHPREKGEVMEFCLFSDTIPCLETVPQEDVQSSSASVSARAQKYIKGVTSNLLMILDLEKLFADPGIIVNEGAGE